MPAAHQLRSRVLFLAEELRRSQYPAFRRMSWFRRSLLLLATVGTLFPLLAAAAADKLGDLRGMIQASFNHDASCVIVRPRDGDVAVWEVSTGNPVPGDVTGASDGYLMSADAKMAGIGVKEGHCRGFDA